MSKEKTYTQTEVDKLLLEVEQKSANKNKSLSLGKNAKIAMEGTYIKDVNVAKHLIACGVPKAQMKYFYDHHGGMTRKEIWAFIREKVAYKERK